MKGKNILALGDSYTIGESIEFTERWPVQLKDSLISSKITVSKLDIIAKTGWTSSELINGINIEKLNGTYDLVTLLIGVNNQYRGEDMETFRKEFKELLDISIKYANDKPENVIVVSIPDWGVTPFAKDRDRIQIASEIDAFNKVKQLEASILGIKYINITQISREAQSNSELIADDGLHPSGLMYSSWAEKVFPNAYQILSNK